MIKVYIAGPYSKGDVAVNVNTATLIADELYDLGYAPYLPHLTHYWHIIKPRPYEDWLKLDKEFLLICDCVLRIPGESSGADAEVDLARDKGIKVFFSIQSLYGYYKLGGI